MTKTQKLEYIQENHFGEWMTARREMWDAVSNMYPMFCLCGKLCSGLHENSCRKFQNKVTDMTLDKLKHLIKK